MKLSCHYKTKGVFFSSTKLGRVCVCGHIHHTKRERRQSDFSPHSWYRAQFSRSKETTKSRFTDLRHVPGIELKHSNMLSQLILTTPRGSYHLRFEIEVQKSGQVAQEDMTKK